MMLFVQWATRSPGDYHQLDSAQWAGLPAKPELRGPVPTASLDELPGWIATLNVQGVEFASDHYAVEHVQPDGSAIRVTAWSDVPPESGPGRRMATVWTFLPLAKDRRVGNVLNTRQFRTVYAERPEAYALWQRSMPAENTVLREWPDFVPPDPAITRHGVLLPDEHWLAHVQTRVPRSWELWRP